MRTSVPSRRTATSLAPSDSRARSAAPERRLARASSQRPSSTSAVTPAATSRYVSPSPPERSPYSDHRYAAVTPTEISVSMVAAPCRAPASAARWNGHAPHTATGDASARLTHCQSRNCHAGTIPSSTTGTARAIDTKSRPRPTVPPVPGSSRYAPASIAV